MLYQSLRVNADENPTGSGPTLKGSINSRQFHSRFLSFRATVNGDSITFELTIQVWLPIPVRPIHLGRKTWPAAS